MLTQTLVLPGLVKISLWGPLLRALWFPVRLHHFVWISPGCGSAVVRRSSRSLRGFGVSLYPSLGHIQPWSGIKLVTLLFFSKLPFYPRFLIASYLDRDLLS